MKISIFLLLTFLLWCSAFPVAGYDRAAETIVQRVVVPSGDDPHGEVQLLTRGDEVVVRTLLYTPILKRVVAVIDDKEQKRWPQNSEGFVASRRYRDELFEATGKIWQSFRERINRNEKRQALAIEFIVEDDKRRIALLQPALSGNIGSLQIIATEVLARWSSRGVYVLENMIDIMQENFNLERQQARDLLEGLVHE